MPERVEVKVPLTDFLRIVFDRFFGVKGHPMARVVFEREGITVVHLDRIEVVKGVICSEDVRSVLEKVDRAEVYVVKEGFVTRELKFVGVKDPYRYDSDMMRYVYDQEMNREQAIELLDKIVTELGITC